MNVYLNDGKDQLPGDLLLETVLRTDLAPVPRTLEFSVRLKSGLEAKLADRTPVWCGREHLKYVIVKRERGHPAGVVQGEDALQVGTYTAFLEGFEALAGPRSRAVIQHKASLGALYLACGARVNIGNDFTVARFAALVGDVPTYPLAIALQEEGAAMVLREGRMSIERLQNLLQQEPVDGIGQFDSSAAQGSELLERHEIPMGYSVNSGGAVVRGNYDIPRRVAFMPHHDERMLYNLSRVAVTRRIINSQMAQHIRAGDVVDVNGIKQLVITGAHRFRAREGITETLSRFWVGDLST